MHVKRVDEMLSNHPTADEIYDRFMGLKGAAFGFYAKKDDKGGKRYGLVVFSKPGDRIAEFYYDKKTGKPYSIVMYNDTTNAANRDAVSISAEEIENKTSDEIALEILGYLQHTK